MQIRSKRCLGSRTKNEMTVPKYWYERDGNGVWESLLEANLTVEIGNVLTASGQPIWKLKLRLQRDKVDV